MLKRTVLWFFLFVVFVFLGCARAPEAPKGEEANSRSAGSPEPKEAGPKAGVGLSGNGEVGQELYMRACAGCHRSDGAGAGRSLFDESLWQSPEAALAVIREGRGAMPGYGARFTEQQIQDIASYLSGSE